MESEWLPTLREQIQKRSDPWVVLEGSQAVDAAIGGWWEVPGVLASEDSEWQAPVWSGLEYRAVPSQELEEIAGAELPGGVVGLAKIPQETAEVAKFLKGLEADALVVVCPKCADAATAGGILRNASAMGAAGILFAAEGVSPFESGAVKASQGAVFRLAVRVADGGVLARSLKAAKFEMLASEKGEGSIDIRMLPPAVGRRALVLGPDEGLGAFWNAACDAKVHLPLADGAATMDAVAMSAALLWELVRDREEE